MTIINVPDTDSFDLWRQKTNLLSLSQGDVEKLTTPLDNSAIAGTISSFGVDLIGTGTSFTTDLVIGSKVRDNASGVERIISHIIDDTNAKTSVAFTPALSSAKLSTVDIISALNSVYDEVFITSRKILIRAIAMS